MPVAVAALPSLVHFQLWLSCLPVGPAAYRGFPKVLLLGLFPAQILHVVVGASTRPGMAHPQPQHLLVGVVA